MSGAPDVEDMFVLPEGLDKIRAQTDEKWENAANFTIERDGHTIGNLLRMQLLKDPSVIFGGYKVPHPLESHLIIKVQTNQNSTPVEAMTTAIKCLRRELVAMRESFVRQASDQHTYQ